MNRAENEDSAAAGNGEIESPLARLSEEQIEAIGREFDAIHDEVFNSLGERDARYIKSMIEMHRRLALLGRAELVPSRFPAMWIIGTASLSAAKILEIMRIDPHQKWHPVYLLQPFYNVLLMALFEWGVAVHDLDFEAIRSGEKSKKQLRRELMGIAGKARTQIVKDYIAFPVLSGAIMGGIAAAGEAVRQRRGSRGARLARRLRRRPSATGAIADAWLAEFRRSYRSNVWANVTANVLRNFWSNAIIFCGHFPDQ